MQSNGFELKDSQTPEPMAMICNLYLLSQEFHYLNNFKFTLFYIIFEKLFDKIL